MNEEVFSLYESNVRSYCRKWPVVFTKAKGSYITDENGIEYIDFFNGAGALDYGHNPDYIKEKLIEYINADGVVHSLDMFAIAKKDFLNYFNKEILRPNNLDYKVMFPGPTGTNAVEAAIKLARKVKQRPNIFALTGAFHGMTLGSLALTTDMASRAGAGVPLSNVVHIPAPYYMGGFDTIGYLKEILHDDHSGIEKPSAIILETTQAEGGIYVLEDKFLKDLRQLCDEEDILLIIDDIQVGLNRTGYLFSFQRADIVPDIVVLSKSLGGYGLPISLTLFKKELDVWKPGEHNGTFRGVQLSFVAAKAGLELMKQENTTSEVKRKEKIVEEYLEKNIKPLLKDGMEIRGIGLIWGIDFKDGTIARAVLDECFVRELIIELAGRKDAVLKIMPSLLIDDETLLKGLDIIKESIEEVL